MLPTLIQMAVIIACGATWRIVKPGGFSVDQVRPVLTSVVYYLFLPAMVLEVLWHAEIGTNSIQYSLLTLVSILFAMACILLAGKLFKFNKRRLGAVFLAASFPNVTYLGLPVLEQTYGHWARSIAIQVDFFATGPLLFTVGIMVASSFGESSAAKKKYPLSYLNVPPFWAALIAVIFNVFHVPVPIELDGILKKLSAAVVPIMLFSLGLALSWQTIRGQNIPYALPVIFIKLLLMPLFAYSLIGFSSLEAIHKSAVIMEMAMPSMVLGIVFCDRYRLDSNLYAMIVTLTTVLSIFTLPLWFGFLKGVQ